MKNEFTIIEVIELLDSSIQKEVTEILNLNHKAANYQALADEKFIEMSKIFEPMLPYKDRILSMYDSIEEIKLINKLEDLLIRLDNIKKNTEDYDVE